MKKDIRTQEITQRLKEVPKASWPRSLSGICQFSSLANVFQSTLGPFLDYALPLSRFLPVISTLGPLQMETDPASNKLSLSEDFTVIIAREKDIAFPPSSSKCLICRLEIMGHVSNWYIPLQIADPTQKWDANLIIPHVQNRNRISLLNLFSYVRKIKNKRCWSGLCERNTFQFVKLWGNEIRAQEGLFLPHGIITSKCFSSQKSLLLSYAPQKRLHQFLFSGIVSPNNPLRAPYALAKSIIYIFKIICNKMGV